MKLTASTVRLVMILVLTAAFAPAGRAQSAAPVVEYGDRKVTLDAATWAKLPRQEMTAEDHGTKATFEGVLLRRVLALVNAPAGSEMKGEALRLVVRVEAADGYQAVFALVELDPGFRDKPILLADKRDGKALPENARPFQMVVGDEARAARWVRQVTRIVVTSLPK